MELLILDTTSLGPLNDICISLKLKSSKSTSPFAVISKMDAIFARHGIPRKVKADNAQTFQSDEFMK